MSVEAGDNVARFIADAAAEQHPVEVSRHLCIELVNAISQERAELLTFSSWHQVTLVFMALTDVTLSPGS